MSEYQENKKTRSEQLQSLLMILETFLDFKDWKPPRKLLNILCGSALLPLLEASLRSGSLLEISKESELFFSFLKIIKALSKHKDLVPCLLDLDPHYQPR